MAVAVKPTRLELMRLKERLKLAERGRDLLREKQDSLIIEIQNYLSEVRVLREDLENILKSALEVFAKTLSLSPRLALDTVSISTRNAYTMELKVRNLLGVKVPVIVFSFTEVEYPKFMTLLPPDIGDAIKKGKSALELIVRLAELEATIASLLMEIEKTKRRVNVLENFLIPDLKRKISFIRMYLDEREREDFTRLKKIKSKLAASE